MPEKDYGLLGLEDSYRIAITASLDIDIDFVSHLKEGNSHHNFDLTFSNGTSAIARFEQDTRIDQTVGERRDFHFNGPISLDREIELCNLVRSEASLPAPRILGDFNSPTGRFLLVEKLPGKSWQDHLKSNNYAISTYLSSLEYLGRDIAKVQKIKFKSFGDVMGVDHVSPPNIHNFTDRLTMITDLKLTRAENSGAFERSDLNQVKEFFASNIAMLEDADLPHSDQPTLILTDLHPNNFFVDDGGKPSGYFDLEFCQSGHPALEFYYLSWGLFSYFNSETFLQAKETFFKGFHEGGGQYDPNNSINIHLETLLAAITAYHGTNDGLRDTWGDQFRDILFRVVRGQPLNYVEIADITRAKTQQPRYPTKN